MNEVIYPVGWRTKVEIIIRIYWPRYWGEEEEEVVVYGLCMSRENNGRRRRKKISLSLFHKKRYFFYAGEFLRSCFAGCLQDFFFSVLAASPARNFLSGMMKGERRFYWEKGRRGVRRPWIIGDRRERRKYLDMDNGEKKGGGREGSFFCLPDSFQEGVKSSF